MNKNQGGMLTGGLIIVICVIVYGYANSLQIVIPVSTTQLSCIIIGFIGVVIAVFSGWREYNSVNG
jgi:multisubunit Na+/H+ antiporter MnhB subunit